MPLTGMSAEGIAELEERVFREIPEDGSIGNQALREAVGLDDELYLSIRNRLRDSGKLSIGRGRGGSIRRVADEEPEAETRDEPQEPGHVVIDDVVPQDLYPNEQSLYDPMLRVLRDRWVLDQPFVNSVVENTSSGGRRADGTWARPDLTCVATTSYPYLPGSFLDIVTFEVKPSTSVDLTAVYEALSHRRAATKAFTLFHVPDERLADLGASIDDICTEASQHGIGVIVAGDPENYDTWDFRVDADRVQPDPYRMNRFIQTQISPGTREQILRWLR